MKTYLLPFQLEIEQAQDQIAKAVTEQELERAEDMLKFYTDLQERYNSQYSTVKK